MEGPPALSCGSCPGWPTASRASRRCCCQYLMARRHVRVVADGLIGGIGMAWPFEQSAAATHPGRSQMEVLGPAVAWINSNDLHLTIIQRDAVPYHHCSA
jgi:hypothetical protein